MSDPRDTALRALVEKWRELAKDGEYSSEFAVAESYAFAKCADELSTLLVEADRPAHHERVGCKAEEWQRDGRGLWAMRACVRDVNHDSRHEFAPWRYEQLLAEARIWRNVHPGAPMLVDTGTPLATLLEQAADALASAQQRIRKLEYANAMLDGWLQTNKDEMWRQQQRIQEQLTQTMNIGSADDDTDYRDALVMQTTFDAGRIQELEQRIQELEQERDLAVAHDCQPYPTADAYEKALNTAKERIATLEQERDRAKLEMLDKVEAKVSECESVGARFTVLHVESLRASPTRPQEPQG